MIRLFGYDREVLLSFDVKNDSEDTFIEMYESPQCCYINFENESEFKWFDKVVDSIFADDVNMSRISRYFFIWDEVEGWITSNSYIRMCSDRIIAIINDILYMANNIKNEKEGEQK